MGQDFLDIQRGFWSFQIRISDGLKTGSFARYKFLYTATPNVHCRDLKYVKSRVMATSLGTECIHKAQNVYNALWAHDSGHISELLELNKNYSRSLLWT